MLQEKFINQFPYWRFFGMRHELDDNLQQYDATWYHRFSKTIHIATEAYYMYQIDVPAVDPRLRHAHPARSWH